MRSLIQARPALAGLCVAAISMTACAQGGDRNIIGIKKAPITQPVPAERPGFGDNVNLVPMGHFEMEGGFQFDDNQGGGSSYTLPSSLLLRTGLTDNIEFRLGFNGYTFNAPGRDGAGDATVGFKIHIHDETTYTPAFSVLPTVSLPTGSHGIGTDKSEPELHFIWSKSLTDNISLGGNVNLAERVNDEGNRKLETAVSVSSGYSFTDRFSGYAEYYTVMSEIHGVRNSDVVDGGFTFLTSERNQLDAYVGTGLNNSASNIYAGLGIAHLF